MFLPNIKTIPYLQTLFSINNGALVIELDQSPKLADLLGLDLNLENNLAIIDQINTQIATIAQEYCSSLILDPIYTFDLANKNPSIFRLEHLASETDPLIMPTLLNNWGVEQIKNNFSSAKLELFYHPNESKALEKKQLVAEIHDYCHHEEIAFILKLVLYTPANEEFDLLQFQESQLTAAQEFRNSAEVIILQFPQDALSSATITAELDIPWLLSGDGLTYEAFKENFRTALENGSMGASLGAVLWQEIGQMRLDDSSPDFSAIERFFNTVFRDRLIEIRRILEENYVESP